MITLVGYIIGGLFAIYAAGFQVTAGKEWRSRGGKRALPKGLAWPGCLAR